jgi:long-chain acyl-CoA synthetase
MRARQLERPWMNSWPRDVPKSIDYPESSLGQMLHKIAGNYPEKPALYYLRQKLTFFELETLAGRFGKALQRCEVRKGDRVALYLPNIPEFVVAYHGVLRIGAICVAISPLYKERELVQILTDSEARVIVCWDRLLQFVEAAQSRQKLDHIVTATGHDVLLRASNQIQKNSTLETESMNTLVAENDCISSLADVHPRKDGALLQYTGGTTGVPKGSMLTHYNLVANAIQFSTWLGMKAGEVHLAALPLFHIYGMTVAMNAPIFTSGSIVLIPDPRDTSSILQAIDDLKPTVFCGVPAMYDAIINRPNINRDKLRSIRVCVSGASPLSLQVQQKFEELTGGTIVEGYGLTEASPVTHVNPLDSAEKNRFGSIGIPISDTEAKIVDAETGMHIQPTGIAGELVIRGPQVMIGYWHNAQETKVALRDNWLYTGDIATIDSDGYFHLVDRKKDMINVSGMKVWPREVEEVLLEHPAVREAATVPTPDATSGEAVKAFVVLRDGFKVTPSDLIAFCKERIADYKAPKIVVFRETLPKNSVDKVLRRELRKDNVVRR